VEIVTFILRSPEVRGWHGGAALTIIINLLLGFQVWALLAQTRRVYRDRSTLGLSVITLVFNGYFFAAFFIYGIRKEALNMVLSGSQFVLYIPLIIGLWKYSGEQQRKQLKMSIPIFAIIPPIMAITPWKEAYLLCLFAGVLVTILLMYRELKNITGVGSVVIGFQFAFLANAIFWFLYGLSIADWPLIIFNPIAAILLTMTILLYTRKERALRR
jgi:uncharacterized protein with PQ loop repeat